NSEKTLQLMNSKEKERPLSVQLFGSDPKAMAKGARFVQDSGVADIIDINFGCSVKKVIKTGAGVALMNDPTNTRDILLAVRDAIDLPLTIKIRSGWDKSGEQAFQIAQIAEKSGVDAIILHPRTASQAFRGKSDWSIIEKLKTRISIPVIGNGDIHCVEDAKKMITLTNCDAVMVGRAALGNPFLLSKIEEFLEKGTYQAPTTQEIFIAMERLVEMYIDYFGEPFACKMLRGRLSWFVKGMPGCSVFRRKLSGVTSKSQALTLIQAFENSLKQPFNAE
ncbi:MAG: tRNA dihydrouridine synthase DusB, partial [Desulfobacteraceae bacterium]|nr:tRNA dihydrouridine synthase DusB [Desulfobacteraceae bacterium]